MSPILERLRESLQFNRLPRHTEGFDFSHLQGEMTVAAKVAMTDGQIDKRHYSRYKIRSVAVDDDYRAMYEALSRRLREGPENDGLPDLIILGGGKI